MKREIRIILSVIVLLVGLIFAALCQPSAQSTSEEEKVEVAVVNTPSYEQPVSYVKETSLPQAKPTQVSVPALPIPENLYSTLNKSPSSPKEPRSLFMQNGVGKYDRHSGAIALKESSFPEPRTAKQDSVPELPDEFPNVKTPLQPKLPKRLHTVIDGDTLRNLALRYLDSESRWEEIYQANRSMLEDPMSLPIGAKLTIPQRNVVAKHASKPIVFPASTELQAARPSPRVSHEVARPIESKPRKLKVLPRKPMVPMTD